MAKGINDKKFAPEDKQYVYEVLGHSYTVPFDVECNHTKERILITASILFTIHGYDAISIRDVTDKVGITSGAFYNHFGSKEELLETILNQAQDMYRIYFKHLDECLRYAKDFDDVLEIIFQEPIRMRNEYTVYIFSFVMLEQRKNKTAEKIYLDDFLAYGIEVIERWLSVCVERGWVKPFDTRTTAQIIINSTLAVIFRALHDSEVSGECYDFNTTDSLVALKEFLLSAVQPA